MQVKRVVVTGYGAVSGDDYAFDLHVLSPIDGLEGRTLAIFCCGRLLQTLNFDGRSVT